MNEAFYASVVRNPPKSHSSVIFDDEDNVIWIDWREEEDAILGYIRDKIGVDELRATISEADNDWGYEVTIKYGNESRAITPDSGLDARHATLITLDELLSPKFEIRFVSDTNGGDTMGVVIESVSDWNVLCQKYGRRLNEHFCPIRELPDLMNTPGNEIDQACAEFANRNG